MFKSKAVLILVSMLLVIGTMATQFVGALPCPAAVAAGEEPEAETEEEAVAEPTPLPTPLVQDTVLDEVKLGAVYPLTGKAGPAGIDMTNGIKLAAEIVNGEFDLPLPLAKTAGLPNLGGAKLNIVYADHEMAPEKALSEAERLITEEQVVALLGAYASSCSATASEAAERHGTPYMNPGSSSPKLTERGFKWFFRTTPHDRMFVEAFFKFLNDLKAERPELDLHTIAVFAEDTLFGADCAEVIQELAGEYGFEVVETILFPTGTSELTSEVQKLKAADADLMISATYVSDQILLMDTAKNLDFNIGGMLNSSGWIDNSIILPTLREDGDYTISREAWALDLSKDKPVIETVNDMYKERFDTDMNGNIARAFTGAYALFMGINNAGSTDPEMIRQALVDLELTPEDLIMPWDGVKFDEKGQNTLPRALMVQVKDMAYHTIWPFDVASMEVIWPMPKWSER